MYKCGWNGCEKAYGTLNHLNAHVTMQSHGQKRVPEGEFFNSQPTAVVATRFVASWQLFASASAVYLACACGVMTCTAPLEASSLDF